MFNATSYRNDREKVWPAYSFGKGNERKLSREVGLRLHVRRIRAASRHRPPARKGKLLRLPVAREVLCQNVGAGDFALAWKGRQNYKFHFTETGVCAGERLLARTFSKNGGAYGCFRPLQTEALRSCRLPHAFLSSLASCAVHVLIGGGMRRQSVENATLLRRFGAF